MPMKPGKMGYGKAYKKKKTGGSGGTPKKKKMSYGKKGMKYKKK